MTTPIDLKDLKYRCTYCGALYRYRPLKGKDWRFQWTCENCDRNSTYRRIWCCESYNNKDFRILGYKYLKEEE